MNSEVKEIETVSQPALSIRETVKVADIPASMGKAFMEVWTYMQRKNIAPANAPFAYYHSWSSGEVEMECGFPTASPIPGEGMIKAFSLPAVKAVTSTHIGPYSTIMETYAIIEGYIRAHGLEPVGPMWEVYLNDPSMVAPEELMTQIIWPIK